VAQRSLYCICSARTCAERCVCCAQGLLWPTGSWCDRVGLEYMAAVLALRAEAKQAVAEAAPA
jgi:hypothetical protein